jgi:nucleoside-diphosphate-sugar epimerase
LAYLVVGGNRFMGTHLVDRLLESGYSVRIYGRGSNRFLELIAERVGEQLKGKYLPAHALLDIPASVLDIRRVKANLRGSPHMELTEGVGRAWDWVRTSPRSEVEACSVRTQTFGGGGIP